MFNKNVRGKKICNRTYYQTLLTVWEIKSKTNVKECFGHYLKNFIGKWKVREWEFDLLTNNPNKRQAKSNVTEPEFM